MNIGDNINDGNWHYIAATTDGWTNLQFYVDGQEVGSASLPARLNTSVPGTGLELGSALQAGRWQCQFNFQGSLDEVAVYPTALSPQQINGHWQAATGVGCGAMPSSGYGGAVEAY